MTSKGHFEINLPLPHGNNNSELCFSIIRLDIFFSDKKELEKLNHQFSVGKKTQINKQIK